MRRIQGMAPRVQPCKQPERHVVPSPTSLLLLLTVFGWHPGSLSDLIDDLNTLDAYVYAEFVEPIAEMSVHVVLAANGSMVRTVHYDAVAAVAERASADVVEPARPPICTHPRSRLAVFVDAGPALRD